MSSAMAKSSFVGKYILYETGQRFGRLTALAMPSLNCAGMIWPKTPKSR